MNIVVIARSEATKQSHKKNCHCERPKGARQSNRKMELEKWDQPSKTLVSNIR